MRATTIDDIYQQFAGLENRIRKLESSLLPTSFSVSGASSINLGAVDGENIMGVRISLVGSIGGGSFSGGTHFLRLRPNGTSPVVTQMIGQQVHDGGASYAVVDANIGTGGPSPSSTGLIVARTDWGSNSNTVTADGVFYTPTGFYRIYHGICTAQNTVGDPSLFTTNRHATKWDDNTTPITSLSLACDAGTFTGRVSLEVIR